MNIDDLSFEDWALHIYKPENGMEIYEDTVNDLHYASFCIAHRLEDKYYKDIFITEKMNDMLRLTSDDNVPKLVANYLIHEALHICIGDIDGWISGSKYDILTGGFSKAEDIEKDSYESAGGGFRGFDEVLP